jgi:ABC-type phosphate/phosphonate transport system substrate-binding protein
METTMPRLLTSCALALLVAILGTSPAGSQEEKIKVAPNESLFPGMSAERLSKAARPFKSLLEHSTGFTGDVVPGGEAFDLANKLKKDAVQLGIFSGVEFAWAKEQNPKLEPLVICVNEKKTVKACLIVRADSKIKKTDDLRGQTLAQPDEVRPHCHVFLERQVVPADTTPKKFFKKIATTADVEEALDSVIDGSVQAAVVDSLAWGSYRDAKPGAAKRLRVLMETSDLPPSVIAYQSGRFNAAQLKNLRDGLIKTKDTRKGKDLLQQLRLTSFQAVPADLDKQLAAALKEFPTPKTK